MALVLPFLAPRFEEHPVQGTLQKFYPISTRMLFQMRSAAKPVARAIATLFGDTKNDIGTEHVQSDQHQRTTITAATAEVSKMRYEQRQAAIEQLIEGLMGESSSHLLVSLIADSMRELFPKELGQQDREEFLKTVPADNLIEMLQGVGKVNRKLFDPLKERVANVSTTLKAVLADRFGSTPSAPSEATATTGSG
jgi:hypothetical protein